MPSTPSAKSTTEHFVTLFDSNFLPAGLCLYRSLRRELANSHLWIVCLDEIVERDLAALNLPGCSLIPLREIETTDLLHVKRERSRAEYCWTLTPFTPSAVFARAPDAHRVTYLDADVYFFRSPTYLLDDIKAGEADVLITLHDFALEYQHMVVNGLYCVQFLSFTNTITSHEILSYWQAQCLEWCYARRENGRFGDQKYLDAWPQRYGTAVRVLSTPRLAMGPWNASRYECDVDSTIPVFFHFHGLRIVARDRMLISFSYRIRGRTLQYYEAYLRELIAVLGELESNGKPLPVIPEPTTLRWTLAKLWNRLRGRLEYVGIDVPRQAIIWPNSST